MPRKPWPWLTPPHPYKEALRGWERGPLKGASSAPETSDQTSGRPGIGWTAGQSRAWWEALQGDSSWQLSTLDKYSLFLRYLQTSRCQRKLRPKAVWEELCGVTLEPWIRNDPFATPKEAGSEGSHI